MDLDLRKDQEMIRKTAREFLDKECPRDPFVREMEKDEKGFTPDIWKKMAKLGWLGIVFPEEYNGMECDFIDLAILLEEMGRACLPGPFLHNTLAGLAILWAGSTEQKNRYLTKISDGKIILTLALNECTGNYSAEDIQTTAVLDGDLFKVNGKKMFVPDAHAADFVLTPVRTKIDGSMEEGISLLLIDLSSPGVSRIKLEDTIAKDKLFKLQLTDVQVSKENLIGKIDQAWPIVEKVILHGAVAECARMTGGARQVLDLSVNYAKGRKQFDRPIGSFQIIQHYLAQMLTDVDGSHYLTFQAAFRLAKEMDGRQEVAMAKSFVNDAYYKTCVMGHQIHGGVGFTEEFDVGLYFRRAKAQELSFGDTDFHLDILAGQMGLN